MKVRISVRNIQTLIKYNSEEAKAAWEKGLKEIGVKEITLGLLGDDIEGTKKVNEYIKNQLETNLTRINS